MSFIIKCGYALAKYGILGSWSDVYGPFACLLVLTDAIERGNSNLRVSKNDELTSRKVYRYKIKE